MKLIYKFCFAFFLVAFISSCNKGFYFDGQKAKEVSISDMGEMYSTYNMSNAEKDELGRQLNNKALVDEIVRYSKENTWPDAINTLDDRINNRALMSKYHFYKVGTIGNKTIVTIPKEQNTHMSASFIPAGPVYIIFASSVVVNK